MLIEIEVTQEDIDRAGVIRSQTDRGYRISTCCPTALAIARTLGKSLRVGFEYVNGDTDTYRLDVIGQKFVAAYTGGKEVSPTRFVITSIKNILHD
jgi:hypothetical protein